MIEMIAEDPPPDARGKNRSRHTETNAALRQWLGQLREAPGVWHRFPIVLEHAGCMPNIKNGCGYGVKPGEFEATIRNDDRRYTLYAKFVGSAS